MSPILFTLLSRGVRSLFGPTRKSSPWDNFSDGGLNQSIKRGLSLQTSRLIDWLIDEKLTLTWLVYWIRTTRSVFTGAGLKWRDKYSISLLLFNWCWIFRRFDRFRDMGWSSTSATPTRSPRWKAAGSRFCLAVAMKRISSKLHNSPRAMRQSSWNMNGCCIESSTQWTPCLTWHHPVSVATDRHGWTTGGVGNKFFKLVNAQWISIEINHQIHKLPC